MSFAAGHMTAERTDIDAVHDFIGCEIASPEKIAQRAEER
jgi:hypothetical protein